MAKVLPAKNIVVLGEAGQQTTASGLIQPETDERTRAEIGVVVACGRGARPVAFEVGDTLVFRKYMGNKTFIGGQELNFLDFKDIVAVLPKEKRG